MKLDSSDIRMIQDRLVPAGWGALRSVLAVEAPLRHWCCIADRHVRGSRRTDGDWEVFDKRYWPGDTFADPLTFALRHEPLDLLLLVRILKAVPAAALRDYVLGAPTGQPNRRVWFLAEHLVGRQLDLPDADPVAAVDLLATAAAHTLIAAQRNIAKGAKLRVTLTADAGDDATGACVTVTCCCRGHVYTAPEDD